MDRKIWLPSLFVHVVPVCNKMLLTMFSCHTGSSSTRDAHKMVIDDFHVHGID